MSMIQIVIGTTCGFLLAQALLFGLRRFTGWVQGDAVLARVSAARAAPAPTFLNAFLRYAAPAGVSVALATLCVWAINDYLAARSARRAESSLFDSSAAVADSGDAPRVEHAAVTPLPQPEPAAAQATSTDPYADPSFKVQHKGRRAGDALRETLVQRSEARARSELLQELQQHARRSQYDCEAAARAGRYLKAGLDVWGFATWQVKYFPADSYRGATLEQCRDIKTVVASSVDLRSTVAQQTQADSEH